LIRTRPGPGSGMSRSTISKGPPGREICTARILDISESFSYISASVQDKEHENI
jgi:hypothetical protein